MHRETPNPAEFLKPLQTLDEVYILLYLNVEMNAQFEMENIAKIFNDIFQSNINISILKLACSKFNSLIQIKEKAMKIKEILKNRNELVTIPINKCVVCNKEIIISIGSCSITYCFDGCNRKEFLEGLCKHCSIKYETDFFTYKN